MALNTLQAESVLANNSGDTIASLFPQWVASVRTYEETAGDGDDAEWCKLVHLADAVMLRIMEIPAATVDELAIKSYLAIRHELGSGHTEFDIDFDNSIMTDSTPHRALIADAMRLSPMLREFVSVDMGAA